MPTLVIEGQRVKIDDGFLKLPPDQQSSTVEEIAKSLKVQPSPTAAPADQPTTEGRGSPRTGADLAKNMAGPGPGELTNDPYGPPGERANTQPSWLDSLFAGTGHGIGNVISGGARIGARMGEATDTGFGPELPKGTAERVDTTARQREQMYQAAPEKKAHPYVAGAGEIAGETAGLLAEGGPMGLATAPARAAPRWLMNLGLGTAGALATPKGDEGMDPASQLKRGAGGLVGAAAGAAVGEVAGSLFSRAIAASDPQKVVSAFRSVMKPRMGRTTENQITSKDTQILGAMDEIIRRNGPNRAADPKSLRDFTSSLGENKTAVFNEMDAMAQSAADQQLSRPNPHLGTAFSQSGVVAQQAGNAVRDAQNRLTMAAAARQRAGSNVYMNAGAMPAEQQAGRQLQQAQAVARAATQRHQGITERMYRPYIDLAPISAELRSLARETRFQDLAPDVAQGINGLATRLEKRGFWGLKETQDNLAAINNRLSAFYRNPTPAASSRAIADAQMAGALRRAMDSTIESLEAPGYQALRLRYGAVREVEKDVTRAFEREANKVPGGIGGIFADLFATEQGLKAAFTLDPHALTAALATKGARQLLKKLNDPNRAVRLMFQERSRSFAPPSPFGRFSTAGRAAPRAGGLVGGQMGAEAVRNRQREPRVPTAGM